MRATSSRCAFGARWNHRFALQRRRVIAHHGLPWDRNHNHNIPVPLLIVIAAALYTESARRLRNRDKEMAHIAEEWCHSHTAIQQHAPHPAAVGSSSGMSCLTSNIRKPCPRHNRIPSKAEVAKSSFEFSPIPCWKSGIRR